MNVKQIIERLNGTSEIGVSRAVDDMLFTPIKNAHLATPALIDVFQRMSDPEIKISCLAVLGKIRTTDSLQFVLSHATSNEPYLLHGVALGFANAGKLQDASAIYYTLLDADDSEAVRYAELLASYFTPLSREEIEKKPSGIESLPVKVANLNECNFEEGAWVTGVKLPNLSSSEMITVRFYNSTALDGPDRPQLATLALIQDIGSQQWQAIRVSVEDWIKHELMHDEPASASVGELVISFVSVPRQWDGFEGTFVVEFDSDWELEHGIEAVVFPTGKIIVGLSDQVASKLRWNRDF